MQDVGAIASLQGPLIVTHALVVPFNLFFGMTVGVFSRMKSSVGTWVDGGWILRRAAAKRWDRARIRGGSDGRRRWAGKKARHLARVHSSVATRCEEHE